MNCGTRMTSSRLVAVTSFHTSWFMMVWCALIALTAHTPILAGIWRCYADLFYLVAASSLTCHGCHYHLFCSVARCSWTRLLFSLYCHVHDIIKYLLLVTLCAACGRYTGLWSRNISIVVLRRLYRETWAIVCMSLARLWDCNILMLLVGLSYLLLWCFVYYVYSSSSLVSLRSFSSIRASY